jgi:diguanylate cyclase (GGDEF)-like protein/PAS domain S-box-containing protein
MQSVRPHQALSAALAALPAERRVSAEAALADLCAALAAVRDLHEAASALLSGMDSLLPLRQATLRVYRDQTLLLGLSARRLGDRLQIERTEAPRSDAIPRHAASVDEDGRVHWPLHGQGEVSAQLSLQPNDPPAPTLLGLLDWLSAIANAALARTAGGTERLEVAGPAPSGPKYRQLVETSSELLWSVDVEGRYTYINPAIEATMGYRPDEIIGRSSRDLQPASEFERDRELSRHILRGERVSFESTYLHKNGAPLRLRIHAAPLYDDFGQLLGAIGSASDVSEYRRAEEALRQSERQLRLVLEQLPAVVWTTDETLRCRSVDGAGLRLLGLSPEQIVGRTPAEVFGWGDVLAHMSSRALAGDSVAREGRRGGRIWQTKMEPLREHTGAIVGVLALALDVTDLRKSQQALLDERERAQATLESIGDGVITTDTSARVTYMNPAAEALCGLARAEAYGQCVSNVFRPIEPETGRPLADPVDEALRDAKVVHLPVGSHLRRRDGEIIPIDGRSAALRDAAGRLAGTVLVFQDISAAQAMAARLTHQATHDALTGLPNRTLLMDRLNQSLMHATRTGGRIAVMFLDVDRFKQINDTLGHAVGDELLKQIAQRLRGCVRRADTVSRQGGDEFIVLLADAGEPMELSDLAEKIVSRLAGPYAVDDYELHLSASLGISVFPEDGADAETLLKHADIAMYHAKQNGRNTFQFFIDDMNRRATERLFIEHSLRRALERGQLVLRYQPQINLASGRIVGAEALLRWRHPKRGLISPAEFVPIAEDSGMILAIGRWVLEEACRQAREWQQQGLAPLRIGINVSTVQLRQNAIARDVERVLSDSGLEPARLELELTETVVMNAVPNAARRLRELKELGLRLSIDDFGTGYSSLSYLKGLPVDSLKIDQAFIRDLTTSDDDAAIADAIIRMGHSLRLTIIAEGVENREALNFLRERNCDDVQGYYFSRPLDPDRFVEMVGRHTATGDFGRGLH